MNTKSLEEALVQVKLYHKNEMHFSALLLWEKILENHPTEFRKFEYADTLRLSGHLSKSEKQFLEINVDDIPAQYKYYYHLHLGQLYVDMGNIKKAKEQFIICIDFDNCDTITFIFLASILKPDRDNAEAIYYLKLALEKAGDIDEVYYNLANRLAIKGDMEEALDSINKCLHLDPNYPNAVALKNDLINYLSTNTLNIV